MTVQSPEICYQFDKTGLLPYQGLILMTKDIMDDSHHNGEEYDEGPQLQSLRHDQHLRSN